MSDKEKRANPEMVTSRVSGVMIDHAASKMQVRDLPPIVSDEKPTGGGKNRGASPLEYVLVGLCA